MRRKIIVVLAVLVVSATVVARIYEEVVKSRWPERGTMPLRFWKSESDFPIDLGRFFNNDGVADKKDPGDANFDCPDHPPNIPGSGYPAENLPGSGTVFQPAPSAPPLLFPVIAKAEFNNIACEGQRVSGVVRPKWMKDDQTASEIAILGAAENGAAEGTIGLEYEDGTVERVRVAFPDWCKSPAGETPAISSDYRFTWDGSARKNIKQAIDCHLYVRRASLDPKRRLIAIILPETPNLHIFAMTMRLTQPAKAVARRGEKIALAYHRTAMLGDAPVASFDKPVAELAKDLDAAATELPERFQRQLVWLKTRCEYLAHRAGKGIIRRGSRTEKWAQTTAESIRADLKTLRAGRDPFTRRRGQLLRGYVSAIDGQIQSYALNVPADYAKSGPARPLVVHMHGHGWYRPFQGMPAPAIRDAIVLSPHGRGSMDYMFIAEEDVLACIAEVKRDYRIDADRVYLMGHSMGGTGSWNLAARFPDQFAGIGPSAGNADSKAWSNYGAKHVSDDGSYAWLRTSLKTSLDPVTYAPNLLHVPSYCMHGEKDRVVPVGNSRSMARAFSNLGYRHVYKEGKGGSHGWRPKALQAEMHDFLFASKRPSMPSAVRIKAGALKYGRAYWVRIHGLTRADAIGDVRANVRSRSLIDLTTKNVTALELDLTRCPVDRTKALVVALNGRPVFTDIPPASGRLILARRSGRWSVVPALPDFRKRPHLEGPVADAFTRSFLLVVGTASARRLDRQALKDEAQRFADDWEKLYTKPPRMKTDEEVTNDDVARHNLILYGGPKDNAVTARIADRLPVTIENGSISVGGRTYSGPGVATKFCYPNPENRDRLVVVIAGAQNGRDMFQTNNLFGNWFQWGPFDNRAWFDYAVFDRRTHSAETCLEFGFFGNDWQPNRNTSWFGDPAARKAAPLRRMPGHMLPPADSKTVYLSDLLPQVIDQHKLPVGFDTSAEGRRLSAGLPHRVFKRGLGVRPPSRVSFRVNRANTPAAERFSRFKATVGIDLEGETKIPSWRAKREWVNFLVYGDDSLLYQTGPLKWTSKPVNIDVPISRAKVLTLQVWCMGARWLVGSAAWGNARVVH
jgi:pimeloyl-ACP methyl ester carboxylesterase